MVSKFNWDCHERALFEIRGTHVDSHIELYIESFNPNSCGASLRHKFYSKINLTLGLS
jgi:hypothetical protein